MRKPPRIPHPAATRSAVKAEAKKAASRPAHLRAVRGCPCVVTLTPGPVEAHHLIEGRSSQVRVPDQRTIPLCHAAHMEIHRHGKPESYLLETYGIDAERLAQALWTVSGDYEAMRRQVLFEHDRGQTRLARAQEKADVIA